MRNDIFSQAWKVGALLVLLPPLAVVAAEATLPASSTEPADLVKAALRTELDGPSESRKQLLDEALRRDPDFAPARWQSGFVRFDGEWLKVEDVPRRARGIEHLSEYRKLRDKLIDTADNHRALARWCHKNKLPDEERVHWAKVLEFEHTDAEAIEALGLQLYNGRLLATSQIDAEKKQAGEARRALQHWQPQFVKWRKAIEHGSPKQLDEALRGLKDLADPAAIPALEAVFAVNGEAPKHVELNKLLIETVGRMPVPEATQVLLRRAIIPDSLETRKAAADELKKRPMHAYVPLLIAALPGKVSTRFNVFILPNGMVSHEHEIFIEGRDAEASLTYSSVINPADAAVAMLVTPLAASRELLSAATIETEARDLVADAEWLRERIRFTLESTTGFANVDDPDLWTKQYNDYYGWRSPQQVKPLYRRSVSNAYGYTTPPTHTTTSTFLTNQLPPHKSCFPAGTPIETVLGLVPIEQLKAGDRVLAQDPRSGELAYKPVQTTTLRPATRLVKLSTSCGSIVATPGHPFWVAGDGWRTTKHLTAGDPLHGIGGAVFAEAIEEVEPAEVYNLVVSEYHNYFVGRPRLLVHDNSPIAATVVSVPGLPLEVGSH